MPMLVFSSDPRQAARNWLGGNKRIPKNINVNTLARLIQQGRPIHKVKQTANKIVATQRRAFAKAIHNNVQRRRQKEGERILTSRAGFFNSKLPLNAIRTISRSLSVRRR